MHKPESAVGILSLQGTRVVGAGSIYDSTSIPAPIASKVVAGATTTAVVREPATLVGAYRSAARELVADGAKIIISNCGLSVLHQSVVSEASGKPTIMSSLLLVPVLWRVFGGGLGILTYDATAMRDQRFRAECGWTAEIEPVTGDVKALASWRSLEGPEDRPLPVVEMESDLIEVARQMVNSGGDRVILVECTAMLPYLDSIRRVAKVPVFDILQLTSFIRNQVDHV